MGGEEFATHVASLVATKRRGEVSLEARADNFFATITRREGVFDRRAREADVIETLTQGEVVEFVIGLFRTARGGGQHGGVRACTRVAMVVGATAEAEAAALEGGWEREVVVATEADGSGATMSLREYRSRVRVEEFAPCTFEH
jgi:secreted Zn-dependent insulinase-like peptidase